MRDRTHRKRRPEDRAVKKPPESCGEQVMDRRKEENKTDEPISSSDYGERKHYEQEVSRFKITRSLCSFRQHSIAVFAFDIELLRFVKLIAYAVDGPSIKHSITSEVDDVTQNTDAHENYESKTAEHYARVALD